MNALYKMFYIYYIQDVRFLKVQLYELLSSENTDKLKLESNTNSTDNSILPCKTSDYRGSTVYVFRKDM